MTIVYMVQTGRYRWRLVSESGHVMQDDISLQGPYQAEQWVKQYISSFLGWRYEIKENENDHD